MIKAITFDLDGVYFINGKSNFFKKLAELGVGEDEARRVFFLSPEMHQLYKKGKWTDEQYWSWALKEWKLSLTVPEIIDLLISGYEVDERVVEVVRQVRANGYKTLVCTNNFPARINGLQKRFGFLDNFDVVVLSYEEGAIKPFKDFFEIFIRRTGVEPHEIFLADDTQDAIDTAKSLGIETFFYTDFDGFVARLKELRVKVG
jgi:putative hydrolase of the HAD superfamily